VYVNGVTTPANASLAFTVLQRAVGMAGNYRSGACVHGRAGAALNRRAAPACLRGVDDQNVHIGAACHGLRYRTQDASRQRVEPHVADHQKVGAGPSVTALSSTDTAKTLNREGLDLGRPGCPRPAGRGL